MPCGPVYYSKQVFNNDFYFILNREVVKSQVTGVICPEKYRSPKEKSIPEKVAFKVLVIGMTELTSAPCSR